ncbi:hypothetical protein [Methylobacterium indicum]|uniref:Uncharacterized protein n=1 Tax=Methylobacterium indicum TaxID=1775910 RepID=A0A8H9CAK6_9HYPH|nr:hypothetical protein [Methylobacterium indicum]BCM87916.1 hypothetical protein mvi_63770 [Methylobacterium indicum]
MPTRTPPTIDEVAVILPAIVRALTILVDNLEPLVELACQSTNLPEEAADALSDLGHTLTEHSRTIMREATERRRTGPGRVVLLKPPVEPGAGDRPLDQE